MACGDASGPRRSVTVTLEASVNAVPKVEARPDGESLIFCDVVLKATATGGGTATWEEGTMHFYAGRDRSEALDVAPISVQSVVRLWGEREFAAGDVQRAEISIGAPVPYALKLAFRYRPKNGEPKTSDVSFTCGPNVTPESRPAVVTALAVRPSSGVFDPGQLMAVDFAAESETGLLRSEVELSGACSHVVKTSELMAKAVTRSVAVPLPRTCRTDVPLIVAVTAYDGALGQTRRETSLMLTVRDNTSPTITPHFIGATGYGREKFVAGEYFVGDFVRTQWFADDNYELGALIWEVLPSGYRDSILVAGATAGDGNIPVRADWGYGPIQLRLYARDAAGLMSNVYTSEPGAVRILPSLAFPTRSTQVSGEIVDVAIDSRRGVVYLMQSRQHRITALSLTTLEVTRTITLPVPPTDLDLTPSGDSLIVTLTRDRVLGVINLRDPSSSASILALPGLDDALSQTPKGIRIAANGKALIVLGGINDTGTGILELDLATGVQRRRQDWNDALNYTAIGIERSHDASTIILHGGPKQFRRYDAATDQLGPEQSADPHFTRPAVDATGRRVAIGPDVYGEDLLVLRRMSVKVPLQAVTALSTDGEYVYTLSALQGIIRSRVSDGATVDRIPNPIVPSLIRVSGDGRWIVTADPALFQDGRISVVELR